MKYSVALLFFVLTVQVISAQKTIEKTYRNKDLKEVHLVLDHVFNISIKTLRTNEVKISAESQGEFASYFNLEAKETPEILTVKSSVDFTFKDANDKLSAHKVQAISLVISVPENLKVTIKSDIGNLNIQGAYHSITSQLTSGNCNIYHARGSVMVQTILGNITAYTNYTTLDVQTRQGTIYQEPIKTGKSNYVLKSIKGDITVKNKK